jgi:hypothetical protein
MTDQQKSKLFVQYLPMVKKLAWRFAHGNPRHYQELLDLGEHTLGYALTKWAGSNDRCSCGGEKQINRTSWIYRNLRWGMLSHIRRECKRPTVALPKDGSTKLHSKPTSWIQNLVMELGDDARTVVSLVLMAPAELAEEMEVRTCARARTALRTFLEEKLGWNDNRVETAWEEVAACL